MKATTKTVAIFAAVVFLVVLDRLFKALAISLKPEIYLFGDWFRIILAKNHGIAFSLPLFGWWLNSTIILIIICLLYFFVLKIKKIAYLEAVLALAIILGAGSNLYDRLKFGYVIDYFSLKYYSIFNIADGLILVGLVCLLWVTVDKNK